MIRRRGLAGTFGPRDAAAQWTWPATSARTGRPVRWLAHLRYTSAHVSSRPVTSGRTGPTPAPATPPEEARGNGTRREAREIPVKLIQRNHACRGPNWAGMLAPVRF